ncbi:hypothetical protein JNW90_34505 [Micromonospora sp. STR1s_5]|nr:hypothetical protein [Micromonospora sp. STR1s_5]
MTDDHTSRPATRPATHILGMAGTMLGVTTTLIGLVKVLETQSIKSNVDELAGVLVVLFLFSAVISYASIRTEDRARLSRKLERSADLAFMLGLLSLGVLALIFAWELI